MAWMGPIKRRRQRSWDALKDLAPNEVPKYRSDPRGQNTMRRGLSGLEDFNPTRYRGPGRYTGLGEFKTTADEIDSTRGLYESLGMSPVDTRDAIRTAATHQLDQQAANTDLATASRLAAQGIDNSGTALALAQRRGIDLAGQRAMLEADIEQDYADRNDRYRGNIVGLAQSEAVRRGNYDRDRADRANQWRLNTANMRNDYNRSADQMRLSALDRVLSGGAALDDAAYRDSTTKYNLNVLRPDELERAYRAAIYAHQQGEVDRVRDSIFQGIGLGLNTAGKAASMGMMR